MKKQLLFKDRHQRGQGPSAGLNQLQEQKCFQEQKVLSESSPKPLELVLVFLEVVLEVEVLLVWVEVLLVVLEVEALEVLPMEALEVLLVVLDLVMVVLEVLLEVVWVAARQLAEQFQNSQLLMELVRGTRLILLCRLLVLLALFCLA